MRRETLNLQNIMNHFRQRWSKAVDVRKPGNNAKYRVVDGILAAFAVFFMQSSSFLEHQRLLESKKGRSNARSLFQVEEIPSDPQIWNLVDPLSSQDFQEDFWFLLDELKEQQHLMQFRNEMNTYAIALDGVSFFSSEKIGCAKCLKRQDRSGVEHFYHSAITPVFVKPGQSQVLPLPPEFIVPQDGSEKQDCERVASKRWLAQHHDHFSDHSVTYLGDDLYANQPLCQLIAETYHQFFIFVCKPESHSGLYEWIAFLDKTMVWNNSRKDIGMANTAKFGNIALPIKFSYAMAAMPCRSIGSNWSSQTKLQMKSCIKTALSPITRSLLQRLFTSPNSDEPAGKSKTKITIP